MKISYSFYLIASLSLSFGSLYAGGIEKPTSKWNNQLYHATFHSPKFKNIVADGYFDLKIEHKDSKPWITTDSYAQSLIKVKVTNGTLHLSSSPDMYVGYAKHPQVIVNLGEKLNRLSVAGPVNVTSKGAASAPRKLEARGYGKVNLTHVGPLQSIIQANNTAVNINGIHSKQLTAQLDGSGNTKLQGQVDEFTVRTNGDVILKARQLKANKIWAQAGYNSGAYLYPLKSIRAFSHESGEIYYYKSLTDNTRYSIDSGNLLVLKK